MDMSVFLGLVCWLAAGAAAESCSLKLRWDESLLLLVDVLLFL